MVVVSFIGRSDAFSFLAVDFNSYRRCAFCSLVEVCKINRVLRSKISKEQGWHSRLVHRLGARGPEFDSRISHPCFDFFPFSACETEH